MPRLRDTIAQKPLILNLCGVFALAMLVPAAYALTLNLHQVARAFLYASLLGLVSTSLIYLALGGRRPSQRLMGPLLSLLAAFVILPVFLALPFYEALQTTSFTNAYFEMVSAITTTGASVFDDPRRLSAPLHLWRAMVGWLGGGLMWVAAAAILAPLNLGGFEVTTRNEPGQSILNASSITVADTRKRIAKVSMKLLPVYVGLTLTAWVLLSVAGEAPLIAICHAMAVMATSGISPVAGGVHAGLASEAILLAFLVFALSRLTFSKDTINSDTGGLRIDPEFRIGLILIVTVTGLLFLRHWIGSVDFGESTLREGLLALWGGVFTVASFLTTNGQISAHWADAQNWSGLGTPGMILMGLALIGGGVATTAGGVKLLRVFALYQNGVRDLERLVFPNSVSHAPALGRRIRSNGAFVAWIFFMLFALSLTGVSLALAAFGLTFHEAMVLTIAALSTTGPLTTVAADAPILLSQLPWGAKLVMAGAMVLGRLETLAIIALISREVWRS